MNSRMDSAAPSGPGQINEFHHAMTYINRIKTRFVDNQEVYKGFLQLLQAYQKEQMNIQEVFPAWLASVASVLRDSLGIPTSCNSFQGRGRAFGRI
jgi:histone deacetylase complex regulatory component SIN3